MQIAELRELLDELEDRHGPSDIPDCRVCGYELRWTSIGGGEPTKFNCASLEANFLDPDGPCAQERRADQDRGVDPPHGSAFARPCEHLQHYRDSEYLDRSHGDSRVIELVEEIRRWLDDGLVSY